MKPRVKPIKRTNPSGQTVWIARIPLKDGGRRSAGTFRLKGPCKDPGPDCCAQHAIDHAIDREYGTAPRRAGTVGTYAKTWTRKHPRSKRTNDTNDHRLSRVLDLRLEGVRLRDWEFAELRRRHAVELVALLLTDQGRSAAGAQNMLRTLSAMAEDAITDEVTDLNPFKGVKVRANDPRVSKAPRRIRVWSWEDMHRLCAAAALRKSQKGDPTEMDKWRAVYAEPMLRVLSDCGLRLGELLPLERADYSLACTERGVCEVQGPHLHIRRTAHEGQVLQGTKTDHGKAGAGRVAPVPEGLAMLLAGLPARIDTRLLFPTPTGRLWKTRNFYRDVWAPARESARIDATPHSFRHSFVSLMRASGIDLADLASAAGHSVETQTSTYTHGLGRSFEAMRKAVG